MQFVSNPEPATYSVYDYLPGMLILIALAMIIFFSLKLKGATTPAAFTAMVIANFVMALLFYPLSIISGQILVMSIGLLPVAAFVIYIAGSPR